VAEFADNLDRVNAVAMRSPGFVWMMPEEEMDAAQNDAGDVFGGNPRTASTMSVWETPQALDDFVHRTVHAQFMAKGGDWFERLEAVQYVIWPIPAETRPTLAEAKSRMDRLAADGPSPDAYDFSWMRQNMCGVAA